MLPHHGAQGADLLHREGGAGGVALGALDEHRLDPGVFHRPGKALGIGGVVHQLHLPVLHAIVLQRAGPLVHHADHPQEGVVGGPHGGDQDLPRLQRPEQGAGDGVGAVDKPEAHQGVLGAEDLGVDLLQLVPAQVVVAVAGGPGKIALGHMVLLERGQDLLGVALRDGVDPVKLFSQFRLGPGRQAPDPLADL